MPEKQSADPAALAEVLAAGILAHVAVVQDDQPFVVPVGYAPWREGIVFHGSTASRLFKSLAAGTPTCATITLLDGLVLARSAFESSMEYRSAMLLGTCTPVTGPDKTHALDTLTNHLLPGRAAHARSASAQEQKATTLIYLPATEWSVKIGAGFAEDSPEDLTDYAELWAGRVRMRTVFDEPEADPAAEELPIPDYVRQWQHR